MIFIGRSLRRADCDSQWTGAQTNGLKRVLIEPPLSASCPRTARSGRGCDAARLARVFPRDALARVGGYTTHDLERILIFN